MKKNSFRLLFLILIPVLVSYIWLCVCCVANTNNLFNVTIIDLINIFLDIVIGGVLACILYFFANRNTDLNSRKAIANTALHDIKLLIEEIKSPRQYSNYTEPWNNTLLVKTKIELDLRLLLQLEKMDQSFIDRIVYSSEELKRYFSFYEATFYETATPQDKDFDKERLMIDKIKYSIVDAISKLY